MMDPVYVPTLTVSFELTLELEHNSFLGKTPEECAETLQDELHDILDAELPDIKGIFSKVTSSEILGQ